ncbi:MULTISPECIES: hypothetical protein [unclassified Mesorhizobium]|uniref:hypothetical protein n=1 Tax=unclassified Mesorhizobium TaxID=325217 RepID=UPI000FDA6BB3|nr:MULTISPECIES: hypothetical protein [unclassified Mesorhizobium]TGT76146.1 hypothetical protein EN809_000535 [Mesorhizobium sp. M2E.F.Ca.ET.166.01.1.1]TGW02261.1 hypothetical protein EN797_000535 [Mesorhizobium sp. M2E.F.Ca.ET.154.01.1.1]
MRGTTLVKLLDDLRAEARLSLNPAHNAQNRSSQVKALQREQERLWEDFDWPHLRIYPQQPVQAGQRYYETPENMLIDRIERVEIFLDGLWRKLEPGIDACEYSAWNSDLDARSWPPRKWKFNEDEDIELWPIPNINADPVTMNGMLRITGIRNLSPLVADDDRADLDDIMLVGFCAAKILASTGAKDAKLTLDAANARYARLRGRLTPRTQYKMFGTGEVPRAREIVIGQYRPAGT